MLSRINKVGGRFRELEGKSFKKVTEEKIVHEELIRELEESIKELDTKELRGSLQIQKLQSMLIKQKRNQKLIK